MNDDRSDWPDYRRAVGERLRAARLRANLTQEALADRAAVSRNLLQRVERGDPEAPRLDSLWRLARAVGMPTGALLADPD